MALGSTAKFCKYEKKKKKFKFDLFHKNYYVG